MKTFFCTLLRQRNSLLIIPFFINSGRAVAFAAVNTKSPTGKGQRHGTKRAVLQSTQLSD